ncbi:hypothetical protein Lal_00045079 [Lupinus albus]|nr:hypothetical protein Lal_00045079 [Lupinus albus]
MVAGAAPPAAVIAGMERMGWEVTHVYGLTECYGPTVVCVWHDRWDGLSLDEKAAIKARQGVRGPMLEAVVVADPFTLERCEGRPHHGRDHDAWKQRHEGVSEEPQGDRGGLRGGWFHTGDLAVWHEDGYVEIKDRSKDIIISGGENISSIDIPEVLEAAVVARHDEKWGETPCAFVTLKDGATATEADIIVLPVAHGSLQVPAHGGVRPAAEDLHRQDPEIRPAQADRGAVRGGAHCPLPDPFLHVGQSARSLPA